MVKLSEVEKFIDFVKKNIKAGVLGIFFGIAYVYIIGSLFGIGFRKHMEILSNYTQEEERKRANLEKLGEVDRIINNYEEASSENLEEIWQAIESNNSKEIIEEANRNHDAVRFLGKMREVSLDVIKQEGEIKNNTHNTLINIYKAHLEIMNEEDPGDCQRAYRNFEDIYQHKLTNFPNDVQGKIKLEITRNMSYCAAVTGKGQKVQKNLTDLARNLQDKKPDPGLYKRDYFWVDISDLVYYINTSEYDKADQVFNKMIRLSFDSNFVKIKLRQHQEKISDNHQDKWQQYLNELD